MAYTIGTSHGPFTGTGSFVIAKPAGIRTIVTNIPAWTGHENESPRRYFRLGRFTLGNSHGFSESQLLEYAQQLVYPIPAIWELLAYDINDGASCTFYELVAVPDLTAMQPWDRTPLPVRLFAYAEFNGSTNATAWTYTVPTARRFMLSSAAVTTNCRVAHSSTTSQSVAQISLNAVPILTVIDVVNTIGATAANRLSGGPLVLNAGDVLLANYSANHTGGTVGIVLEAAGFLFDA